MEPQTTPHLETQPSRPRPHAAAGWLLGWPLGLAVGALCVVHLLTWVPHYLTWPWYPDHDVFGTMALGWDRGLLPYHDLYGNNFPGALYLCWILGKLCGWGKTYPLFAADALIVVLFGVSTLAWSRRRLGRFLPGLVGYATFLGYYLSLDYSQVAQRDWHAAAFGVMAIQLAEAWPGRLARLASAAAMALALVFRPQAVLFAPAILMALWSALGNEGLAARAWLGRALEWGAATALFLCLGFLPLMVSGVFSDFLNALRMFRFGGGYNQITPWKIIRQMTSQLQTLKIGLVPIASALLWPWVGSSSKRVIRTWAMAFVMTLLYAPLSPASHVYLIHPLMVVWAMNVGVLVHLVLENRELAPSFRLVMVLLVMGLGLSLRPRFCNPRASLDAIGYLERGEDPGPCPTGYTFNVEVPAAAAYPWENYRDLLAYLRTTDPDTRLANALKLVPAITGPVARLSALPAESVAWLTVVRKEDEDLFVAALERAP